MSTISCRCSECWRSHCCWNRSRVNIYEGIIIISIVVYLCFSVHAYMQTFGALTQPLSLESISRHSINFYEAQWQQHQMELCQPLYPRSNTISVFSDISSDSSFSSGSPERFSGLAPALPVKMRRVREVIFGDFILEIIEMVYIDIVMF